MTPRQIYDNVKAARTAKVEADAAVDADKAKLTDDTATAQQAAQQQAGAENVMTTRFPEGVAYAFGGVIVTKLHGTIEEIPVGDDGTDLPE